MKGTKMSIKLTVWTPNREIFETYYYGFGEIEEQSEMNGRDVTVTVVDYGDDRYRADYQAGRFASGLYHAEVWEGAPNEYADEEADEEELSDEEG